MSKQIKGEIRFDIPLCPEQKEGKRIILNNEISIITGNAGCGKSLLIAETCLDLIFKKQFDKVFIARPTVEVGKTLGYLPGVLDSKLQPYISAFIDNLHACYKKEEKINSLLEDKVFEFFPIQMIRGKTIRDGQILVIEEAQNVTRSEMLAILTRLGPGGKVIVGGDTRQKDGSFDGLDFALELQRTYPDDIGLMELKENHRSGIVKKIIDYVYGLQ